MKGAAWLLARSQQIEAVWLRRLTAVANARIEIGNVELNQTGNGPAGWTTATATGAVSTDTLAERYAALVAAGSLTHDPQQAACVQRLDRLRNELRLYNEQMAYYHREHVAYQQARHVLQRRLMAEEEERLEAEVLEASEAGAAAGGVLGSLQLLLKSKVWGQQQAQEGMSQRRTRQQRHLLARARVERRLTEQLGPAPAPPPAPKGVYLHGSVGSGKSMLMDMLAGALQREGCVAHQRRLHFNTAMLELHSRMHDIESSREAREREQLAAYAAAVGEQQQRDQQQQRPNSAAVSEAPPGADSSGGAWQQILRLDPIAQKLRRSKLARLAFRRMMRDKLSRSQQEHSEALAAANAPVIRKAARALIRNCDTLQLMHASSSSRASDPASAADVAVEAGVTAEGGSSSTVQDGPIASLLCFDEMQVNDPFTAVALKGLMEALLAEGCVVVTTSNRAPWELDRHGLHEEMFDHFMHSMQSACEVLSLNSQDYRRLLAAHTPLQPLTTAAAAGAGLSTTHIIAGGLVHAEAAALRPPPHASYFYPLGPEATAALEHQWSAASGQLHPGQQQHYQQVECRPRELRVMFGRRLRVERCVGGVARFTFSELCAVPLGAADYLALAQTFHTLFLEGVPQMSMQARDQARRFITLVDELYQNRTRLICSAAVPPDQLFAGAGGDEPIIDLEALQFETAVEGSRLRRDVTMDGGVAPVASSAPEAAATAQRLGGAEERFAFARAVSRLYEMQTEMYLASRSRHP